MTKATSMLNKNSGSLSVCRWPCLSVCLLRYQYQGPDKPAVVIFSAALEVKANRSARAVTVWTCWHVSLHSTVVELSLSIYRVYVVYGVLNIEQPLFNVITAAAAHKCSFRHQLEHISVIYCNSTIRWTFKKHVQITYSTPKPQIKDRKLYFA